MCFSLVEAGLNLAQFGHDDRLAVAKDRDLAGELVDLGVVLGELARQDALAVALLGELSLALVQLGLQILGAGTVGPRDRDHGEHGHDERGAQGIAGVCDDSHNSSCPNGVAPK